MTEAEVVLVLTDFLLTRDLVENRTITLAIDGAQVTVAGTEIFPVRDYLRGRDWVPLFDSGWRGSWTRHRRGETESLTIHSKSGEGDLVAGLRNGRRLRVEAKGGPIARDRSSSEYRKLREALGQCLTTERIGDADLLAVAVPDSQRFRELAERWRRAPLVARTQIQIVLASPEGGIDGLFLSP